MSTQRGFTLLEITVVVILVGLLALTIGGSAFTVSGGAAGRDAVRMAARLAHARAQGVLAGGSCLALSTTGLTYGYAGFPMRPLPDEGTSVQFESGLKEDPPAALCFDATGRVCAADGLDVTEPGGARYRCGTVLDVELTFTETGGGESRLKLHGASGLAERLQ